jgi:hypothetical protein
MAQQTAPVEVIVSVAGDPIYSAAVTDLTPSERDVWLRAYLAPEYRAEMRLRRRCPPCPAFCQTRLSFAGRAPISPRGPAALLLLRSLLGSGVATGCTLCANGGPPRPALLLTCIGRGGWGTVVKKSDAVPKKPNRQARPGLLSYPSTAD